jgi:hypothetical protein
MSVELVSASYGSQHNGVVFDVLDIVKSVQASGAPDLIACNALFTDTLPNVLKDLVVTYLVNGETKSLMVVEGQTLTFADLV